MIELPCWSMEQYHMTPDEFRRRGLRVIEWIAGYMERVESLRVQSDVEPGDIRARLPARPPVRPEPFDTVMADLDDIILPGLTHWQSPNFFGFFNANNSGPSILGDLLSSGLGVQGMLWSTSPAATELETHILDWMVELLDLPGAFLSSATGGGVIQDSASSATLCAIVAARERATAGKSNRQGTHTPLVAYASTEAHSSVEKGMRVAGVGSEQLHLVPVDETYALDTEALQRRVAADVSAGLIPFFVCATAGTTSSLAFDPLRPIGEICRRHGMWLHVDAAHAGTAALCPEFRFINDGAELADSYCFNPHKWMFTNFDCDALWVADREALIDALSIVPEYLRNEASESGGVIDYRDWQVPLGRRFRALKLWLVLRHYGADGLRHHVREHVRLARQLSEWIEADVDFELAAPVRLNLVCFRHRGGDAANRRIMDEVNGSGRMFLSHTRLDGTLTLRMVVGQTHVAERHVRSAWELVTEAARLL